VINEFAEKHGIPIEHVDIEQQPDVASEYNVQTVPTTIAFDDAGAVVDVIHGAVPSPVLTNRLRDYL